MNKLYSSLRGFTFNNIHNHDMNVVMHSKSIQPPSKKKIKESVPFMNGSYDFSTVGSNGEIVYTERTITVVLGLPTDSKERLHILYSKTIGWLMDVEKSQLIFDDIKSYYFIAEVESVSTFEEVMSFGRLTVTFTADPFKTSIEYEGDNLWDTFNFEEDILQDIEFAVSDTKTISLYNYGRSVTPVVNCTEAMTILVGGVSYELTIGDNAFYGLKLINGFNTIVITGTGNIKFLFKKQVI